MAVRFPHMVLPFSRSSEKDIHEQWRKYYDIDYAKSNIWRNILRSLSGTHELFLRTPLSLWERAKVRA